MEKTCFRWDDTPKSIYFYYMFGITLIGVVFAFIIMFNLTRPQTKRKNIIADLVSQARGTIFVCFLNFLFWLFAYMTYMRNAESDLPNFYCEFIMVLGLFGLLVIFLGYGVMSKRFRQGLRGEKSAMKAKYKVKSDDNKSSGSSLSRPSTSISMVKESEADNLSEEIIGEADGHR